ncbi:MAG: hypothetical protein R2726_18800 [Acidimicrobiales bacterium]
MGGKPEPACKYGVGVVSNLAWVAAAGRSASCSTSRRAPHYSNPIGSATSSRARSASSAAPASRSSMTPDEIVALRDQQRLAGWTGPSVLG